MIVRRLREVSLLFFGCYAASDQRRYAALVLAFLLLGVRAVVRPFGRGLLARRPPARPPARPACFQFDCLGTQLLNPTIDGVSARCFAVSAPYGVWSPISDGRPARPLCSAVGRLAAAYGRRLGGKPPTVLRAFGPMAGRPPPPHPVAHVGLLTGGRGARRPGCSPPPPPVAP